MKNYLNWKDTYEPKSCRHVDKGSNQRENEFLLSFYWPSDMKVKIRNFPSPRSIAQSSKCSSGGVVVISLQVGDCQLWSLVFHIQRCYSVVFVPHVYCTLIPQLWDVCWPTILRTHGISPIKENHCNKAVYGMVLYCKQYM